MEMGKVPVDLRRNIAANIRNCRCDRYPNWGGAKLCAREFGVSPQQWSQWERGTHMPDEFRIMEIAQFFDVTTEYLRRDNSDLAPDHKERRYATRVRTFGAVRIDNGVEVPLRIEAERIVYQSSFVTRLERII